MRASARRAGRALRRVGRLLLGRNALRRPADRIEAAVVVTLAAAFVTAAVLAASFAGHLYRSEHAEVARLRPTAAVLSQPGPLDAISAAGTRARWRLPNGTLRSGTLTEVTAPAVYGAPTGASVQIWLEPSGRPAAPPPSSTDIILTALLAAVTTSAGAALVLILAYHLCRMLLDRHRLARWESAWAATGPQWTRRR